MCQQNQLIPSHIESVTSFQETGKAATKTDNCRSFTLDLHLWMQAWSNKGENMLVSVESTDKFDSSTIAFDCSVEEFRSIEASLYQVLHRTTANGPLRIVQETRGRKGFEAWHAIVRRYDQRNMLDTNSACATLISNICKEYISNYRKFLRKLYLQHEFQHER